MLDSLHKSILWIVQMSVLHDISRAWFRITEGRFWSVNLKCIQTVSMLWRSLFEKPHCLQRDLRRLRADTCHRGTVDGAAPVETSRLSRQLFSCSPFLISQGALRGHCLDCHGTVFYIFTFSCAFFNLSVLVSGKLHI